VVYNACNSITAFKVSLEDYSSELSAVSFYIDKIEEKALKLEEKLKRKLSVNEDCPKGCKGKNCINCVGIAGKIDQIISKLNEAKALTSDENIKNEIDILDGSFRDYKDKVLTLYGFYSMEGALYLEPERYMGDVNDLRDDVSLLSQKVSELKGKVKENKILNKLNDVDEKISDIDEKIEEMESAISEYEEEVEEIIEDSGYRSVSELVNRENLLTSLKLQFENTIESLKAKCEIEGDLPEETSNPSPNPTANTQTIQGDPERISILGYVRTRDGIKISGITLKFEGCPPEGCGCQEWGESYEACGAGEGAVGPSGCAIVAHAQTCKTYRCIRWVNPDVQIYTVYKYGTFSAFLIKGYSYEVKYSTPNNYPYPDVAKGENIYIGKIIASQSGYVNLVLPYPYQYDIDHDNIDDKVEKVVAEHHNPWWSFDSSHAVSDVVGGERFFPINPKYYYTCNWSPYNVQFCDIPAGSCRLNTPDNQCAGDFSYDELGGAYGICLLVCIIKHEVQWCRDYCSELYINATELHDGHGDKIPFATEDVFYNVEWRKGETLPARNQFHIQYYFFFNYNDTEALFDYGDHFGDWEWLCVYPYQIPSGVYSGLESIGGRIEWMHYHGHGVRPGNCSEYCERCWNWSDGHGKDREVSVTRAEMEERGVHNYKIVGEGPEIPKVWVGDDVHSFWSGYGGVPRTACSVSYVDVPVFEEGIDNCPAPQYDFQNKKIKICGECEGKESECKNKCENDCVSDCISQCKLEYESGLWGSEMECVAAKDCNGSCEKKCAWEWPKGCCECGCGDIDCQKKYNCLRYFTNLYSIENIIGANYDLTVRDFGGRWGGWGKEKDAEGPRQCPHGPKGPEKDRDYDGRFDNEQYEK
jgi:predicted  nucleic acid-binding Zn-ribbon protein